MSKFSFLIYIYFDKNFWTHRSTPRMTKNDPKKFFSPKAPNHIKLSVEVRNDAYNGIRVFLEKKLFYFFSNLNDHFRACFGPIVKNLTCTIRSVNPIGHFSCGPLFLPRFMQKIRGLTHVSRNFYEFQILSFLPYWAKIHQFPFRSSHHPHVQILFKIAFLQAFFKIKY